MAARRDGAEPMIHLQNASKDYASPAGPFRALAGVDLEVARGELVAIVGKSGSGKSTLLNLVGGIDEATSGVVSVGGTRIGELAPGRLSKWRGKNVGFVFQFFQLLPTLTVAENVMLPMDFCRTFPARERRARAVELLERVGISEQADKLPAALSGGQLQRAAIARAIANVPAVVLADEPTGNLDSSTAADVLALFRALTSSGTTVVIATHDRDIAAMADRVVALADGVVVAERPAHASVV